MRSRSAAHIAGHERHSMLSQGSCLGLLAGSRRRVDVGPRGWCRARRLNDWLCLSVAELKCHAHIPVRLMGLLR